MNGNTGDIVSALKAVLGRLNQVNARWHEALAMYFDPIGFRDALQHCITTSRTVTFILQSNKAAIPDFDSWYEVYREKFAADPVMKWVVAARNKIEKQGDLETLSQIRAELVAAYVGNPVTDWTTVGIDWSPDRIRKSIPSRLLDSHVVENGVLVIERRWVDSELRDYEVLDALAHVYGQLALMIVDLHVHLGVPIPEQHPDLGQHLLRNLGEDGRLPSMERPLEDRAIYIAVKDGSIIGYRREFRRTDPALLKKAQRRYRQFQPVQRLTESASLLDIAKAYFQMTRVVMIRDGYHLSMFIPLKGAKPANIVVAQPQNRADKYMLMRDIARYVRRIGADGLLHMSETWIARQDDIPKGGYPDEAPNRSEALTLMAANSAGEVISLLATIQRKRIKKHKVKRLGPTIIEENERVISLAPVLEVWGKLNVLRLNKMDEWDPWLKEHFGHEERPKAPKGTKAPE